MKINKILIIAFSLWESIAFACDACDLQQPKVTRGLTHGAGPENAWEWVAVGFTLVITVLTLYYFFKYLFRPESKRKVSIKTKVLNY